MTGIQLLNYRIEKLMNESIMESAYLATDTLSNKQVTIRVINPYIVHHSAVRERLQESSQTLADLKHPYLAKFYTFIEQAGHLCLITEYVEGITLKKYMHSAGHSINETRKWHIFMQILNVFEYAHKYGITHLSINPENIIICPDDRVKVLDFGIVSLFADPSSDSPKPAIKLAKVQYLSPEQVQTRASTIDMRSDVYSLGIILFELLTKQDPYPGVLSEFDIQTKITKDPLPPIKLYTQDFSQTYKMQAIVDKATAKNPAMRFQNYEEFKESMQEEKDARETLIVSQLMQDIAVKTNPVNGHFENSTIKLAQQKTRKKVLTQVLFASAILASAMFVGFTIQKATSANNIAVVNENDIIAENKIETKRVATDAIINKKTSGKTLVVSKKPVKPPYKNKIIPIPKAQIAKSRRAMEMISQNKIANAGFGAAFNPERNSVSEMDLQIRVKHFYEALRSKNLNQVEGYYTPTLTRFFNEYGVPEDQLQELLTKAWERTPEDKHNILWDTFRYYRDTNGNYIIDFYMNYQYRRSNHNSWRTRKIYTLMKMDKALKIYYMSGD